MLPMWTEMLPLFVVRWFAKRMCMRVSVEREGCIRWMAVARPDVYVRIGGQHGAE